MSLTHLLFMGASSHTVLMIRGGNSNSTVDKFDFILFLLITYHIPFLFFQKNTPFWRRFIAKSLRVACLRTKSRDISPSILSLSPIHLYSLLLLTSHIYYLSFIICHFRVDTTLIWILFLVQREGGEGRLFLFLFLLFF